jgi:DNA-binding GntR family transcriptional regulator
MPVTLKLTLPTRHTLADSIARSLREAIFGGQFSCGHRLAEGQLAGNLKVSRAPVREALATLEREGLVTRSPSGGTSVTCLAAQDVEEICSLRLPLETLAVRLAITKGNEGDWKELAENIRMTEQIDDAQQLVQMDLEFHEKLVRASRHTRLLSSWLNLRSQLRLIMAQRHLAEIDARRSTVQGHKRLLGAIQAGDASRAVAILERLLRSNDDWMMKSFQGATPC